MFCGRKLSVKLGKGAGGSVGGISAQYASDRTTRARSLRLCSSQTHPISPYSPCPPTVQPCSSSSASTSLSTTGRSSSSSNRFSCCASVSRGADMVLIYRIYRFASMKSWWSTVNNFLATRALQVEANCLVNIGRRTNFQKIVQIVGKYQCLTNPIFGGFDRRGPEQQLQFRNILVPPRSTESEARPATASNNAYSFPPRHAESPDSLFHLIASDVGSRRRPRKRAPPRIRPGSTRARAVYPNRVRSSRRTSYTSVALYVPEERVANLGVETE